MPRKSVTVETEVPDVSPPADWSPESGVVEIYRFDPPGGFLGTLEASEARAGTIQEAWGGGLFELVWQPPDGSEAKPKRRRLQIAGAPRDLDATGTGRERGAAGVAGALLSRLTSLETEMAKRQSAEWQALLELTRKQSREGLDSVVSVVQANSERLVSMITASSEAERRRLDAIAERDRERAREERERDRERAERERESERARMEADRDRDRQFYAALATLHGVGQGGGSEADDIERMQRLASLAQTLGGGWVGALLNAAPGLMTGAADAFGNVARATAEVKRQRSGRAERKDGTPAEALPVPSEAGFSGNGGSHPTAAATAATAAATAEQPEYEPTDEEYVLLGWLDWLRTVPASKWQSVIRSQLSEGVIPSLLVAPLRAAIGGHSEALRDLLRRADAEDIWEEAAALFGGSGAARKPATVESPGRPAAAVGVAAGDLDKGQD